MHVDGCHFEKCFSVNCQLSSPEVKFNICIFSVPSHPQGRTKQRVATLSDKQLNFDSLHVSLEVSSNFKLVKVVLSL